MSENVRLVDPLAVFFRPMLRGLPALTLDSTSVEIELLPPLARVAVTRSFTNRSGQDIEAVLTLPATAPDEVTYGLTVTINGVDYVARATSRAGIDVIQTQALYEGRRAIVLERLEGGAQLISISGIEPGAEVSVRIESVRPLRPEGAGKASLSITLSAAPKSLNDGLSEADGLMVTREQHPATVTVLGAQVAVQQVARSGQASDVSPGEPHPVNCADPINLTLRGRGDQRLDLSVGEGWIASSQSRDLSMPFGDLTSEDYLYGVAPVTGAGDVYVATAFPLEVPPSPGAQAVAAFAAAHWMTVHGPSQPDEIQRRANLLTDETALVFIGEAGDISYALPTLRKVALPEMLRDDPMSAAHEDAPQEPPPLAKDEHITPGMRPPSFAWLNWSPIAVLAWIILDMRQIVPGPGRVLGLLLVGLIALNALRLFPRYGPERRRLFWLFALALPWIASIVFGPELFFRYENLGVMPGWMMPFQVGCFMASVALSGLLIAVLPGARRFAFCVVLLNLIATFLAVSNGVIVLSPGA